MKYKEVYEFDISSFQDLSGKIASLFNSDNSFFDNSHIIIEKEHD